MAQVAGLRAELDKACSAQASSTSVKNEADSATAMPFAVSFQPHMHECCFADVLRHSVIAFSVAPSSVLLLLQFYSVIVSRPLMHPPRHLLA